MSSRLRTLAARELARELLAAISRKHVCDNGARDDSDALDEPSYSALIASSERVNSQEDARGDAVLVQTLTPSQLRLD